MSTSTTNGARRAPSASCCSPALLPSSSSPAGSSPSIASWVRNDDALARPHRLCSVLRAGAALPDLAGADHRTDVVFQRPLPQLSAAVAIAALVSGVYRQFDLDAG